MGSDEAITMTQLADMLIKISGKKIDKEILYRPDRQGV